MSAPRKIKAHIVNLVKHDPNVITVSLKPELNIKNKFEPGQFLHFTIDEYDPSFNWPESRVFSIATSPTRAEEIDLIISRKGYYTKRIFNEIKIGDIVWIKLPYGTFNFCKTLNRTIFLIAGGTGITPFVSYLQFLLDKNINAKVSLHYGVKKKGLIIIDELLNECIKSLENFNLTVYLEEDDVELSSLNYSKGTISINNIISEANQSNNPIVYLAGPPKMINDFYYQLLNNKFQDSDIIYDKWE